MVSAPAVTPVTTPALLMVALPLLAAHVPPLTASASVIALPAHTAAAPVMAPAFTEELIVIALVAEEEPQLLLTV